MRLHAAFSLAWRYFFTAKPDDGEPQHVHHRVGGVQGQHLHELNSHHQQQCGGEEIPQGEGLWGEEQGPASLPEQKYRPADDHQQDHGGDEQLQSTGGLQQQDVGGMTVHGASLRRGAAE